MQTLIKFQDDAAQRQTTVYAPPAAPAELSPLARRVLREIPGAVRVSAGVGLPSLLIYLLIGVALVFLIRNMNGRLRRLPPTFEPPQDRQGPKTEPGEDEEPDADSR